MITDSRIEALLAVDRDAVLWLMREAYYNGEVEKRVAQVFWYKGNLYQQLLSEALLGDSEPQYVDTEVLTWAETLLIEREAA